jgi:RNA polymerase sigma-70 factor (ECF subfamily)
MMGVTVAYEGSIRRRDEAFVRAEAMQALSAERRFEDIVDRYERRLRRVIYGMLGDANRIDDVLQEALLRAYRGLPARFDNEHLGAAWLYRIVHRVCLNELRARGRRPESPGLPSGAAGVSDDLDSGALVRALSHLKPKERAVVLLVDLVGLDYEDAANALRIPAGTVASRLNRARRAMRGALLREGIDVDA